MKLRKYLALFLAAALMVSALPQRGSAAAASEITENAAAGERDVLAEAENPDLELGGNAGSINESETADKPESVDESGTTDESQTVDESAAADKSETPDGQETPDEQDMPDEPDGDDRKDSEETKAPEKSGAGETTEAAEAKEPGQTDLETSIDDAMTETDEPLDHTVSEETEESNEETADSGKADNTERAEVPENGVPKTAESEISNEVLAVNPEDGLEIQERDIAGGVDGDITWRIDADGKLTLNGTGDYSRGEYDYETPWHLYSKEIISAEVNIVNMTDASFMLSGCNHLVDLKLENFDTTNISTMDSMFSGCSGLTNLDLSNFDTTNVTAMESMFSDCSGLKNLDLSNFDTTNVTTMESMFSGCSGLINLDLSSFDTTKVSTMAYMFNKCHELTNLDLSNFDTTNVTMMESMFSGCSGLTNLDLSSFDTTKVSTMKFMFSGCSGLTELNLDSFDTVNVMDMSEMFIDCSGLTSLDLSNFNTENVISMTDKNGGMFSGCSGLTDLDLSNFNTEKIVYMDSMFYDCKNLKSLDLSSFNTENVTGMMFMFSGCSNLVELDLSNFNTINVTRMYSMFSGCSNLIELDLSNFNTRNVTGMSGMFESCSSLISLNMSSFDVSNTLYMEEMFTDCHDLFTIYAPYNVLSSVALPLVMDTLWYLPNGTEIAELPQNLDYSVMITRRRNPKITTTTPDLNMDDVIRVKYVPYSYTVETNNWDENNKVTFSIEKGELAEGLKIYPETGEIYGVPLETGEFPITVKASYSNPEYLPSYADLTLTVIDNTDNNVFNASDAGYEVEQYIGSQVFDSADSFSYVVTESADQLFISAGAYSEFMDFWLNGRKLVEGEDYTKESGSTRITIRKQTFEEKADQDGTNTIAAEFRVGGNPNNDLKRTAQNFRMDIQGGNSNNEYGSGSGSGSRGRGGDSGGSSSGSGTAGGSYATSVIRLVDASGNPLPDTILELHSTPQEARTDQNGIAVFAEVENGVHTLYAKNGNGTIFALKSFELLFGENTGIMNDQITVKAGTAFTLNVQVDGNELKFLNLQEGDLYQVVSAATSDDTRPAIWFLLAVLSAGTISGGILYRRRKQYAGSMQ